MVVLYGAIVLAMLPLHEPWCDEAEPWLIARDLSFVEIIRNVPYAGHPPLWNFIQAPLAKLGFPFVTVGVLNALCATAAVAVLVFRSPFSAWQKAAACFSLYFVFTYGMVWRNYCLVMLGFFLVAATYPSSQSRPIRYALAVALLANGCVPSLIVAPILLGIFVIEWVRRGLPAAADGAAQAGQGPAAAGLSCPPLGADSCSPWARWLACLIMAVAIALPALALVPGDDVHNKAWFHVYDPYAPLNFISGMLFYGGNVKPSACVISILAFAVVLWDLRRKPSFLALVVLTYLGWSYVFTFKRGFCDPWHVGLMIMLLITALWVARAQEHAPNVTLRLRLGPRRKWLDRMTIGEAIVFAALAISAISVPQAILCEIHDPFSGAKEMAAFIRSLDHSPTIATYPSASSQAVLPWLPEQKPQFWHIETGSFGTFCKETVAFESFKATSQEELLAAVRRGLPLLKPWLLLGLPLPRPDLCGYELAHQNPRRAWGFGPEDFWLYKPTTTSW
jgi:hypothetical protein